MSSRSYKHNYWKIRKETEKTRNCKKSDDKFGVSLIEEFRIIVSTSLLLTLTIDVSIAKVKMLAKWNWILLSEKKITLKIKGGIQKRTKINNIFSFCMNCKTINFRYFKCFVLHESVLTMVSQSPNIGELWEEQSHVLGTLYSNRHHSRILKKM